jgi:glycosyltransferase 2 family protein
VGKVTLEGQSPHEGVAAIPRSTDGFTSVTGDAAAPSAGRADRSAAERSDILRSRILRPRTLVSFGLAIAILVLFISRLDLDIHEVGRNVRSANVGTLILGIALYLGSIALRAVRWRLMLARAAADEDSESTLPSIGYVAAVMIVSWFFNCILPAKLGDAYRIYRVRVDNNIRYTVGVGSVITERVVDLIVLVLMLSVSGVAAFHGEMPSNAQRAIAFGTAMVVAAIVGLVGMWAFRERIERKLPARLQSQFSAFQQAIFTILRYPLVPVGIAVLIWLLEGGRVFFVAKALHVDLDPEMAIFVGMMAALLTTLPITPAGLGVVEVAMVTVLKIADVPTDAAGSIAFLDRLITYWALIVVGALVYLWTMRRINAPVPSESAT